MWLVDEPGLWNHHFFLRAGSKQSCSHTHIVLHEEKMRLNLASGVGHSPPNLQLEDLPTKKPWMLQGGLCREKSSREMQLHRSWNHKEKVQWSNIRILPLQKLTHAGHPWVDWNLKLATAATMIWKALHVSCFPKMYGSNQEAISEAVTYTQAML